MRLFLTTLLLIFIISFNASSQAREDSITTYQNNQPLRVGVNAGVGVGSMRIPNAANTSFFSSFLETNAFYSLSPRMGLIMGVGYSRFNFNNPSSHSENSYNPFLSQENVYLSGGAYYHLNDRLTISGMAQFSVPANTFSQYSMARNPFGNTRSFDFNANYKVSEHFSIGAGVRYTEGNFGNGFGTPFMSPSMMPFGGSWGNPYSNPFGPANYRR